MTIGELNELNISNKEEFTLNDFAIIGYLSALKHIKSNNNNNGSNILIMLNNPNREENDCYISIFLAMFLCCLYINDLESILKNTINKSSLYEMVILTLTEIFEKNNNLRNLLNINFYLPDIYFKIFLEKNSFGFNQGNLFYQSPVSLDKGPLSLLIFDSLSPEPIKYYSSSKYWNKRKVEVRLAMALMIKRYKENISLEDLIKNCSSIEEFLKIFENNYEITLKSIDVYLKKEAYNLTDLKAELPVDKILKDIHNYQGALLTKEFKLCDNLRNEEKNENGDEIAHLKDDFEFGNKIVALIERDVNELYSRKLINQVKIDQIDAITYSFSDFNKEKEEALKIENNELFCMESGESFMDWLLNNFRA